MASQEQTPAEQIQNPAEQPRSEYQPLPGQTERPLLNGETVFAYGESKIGGTTWEHMNNVDMLGPEWEQYNLHNERIVFDWDDTCKDTGKYWIQAHREVLTDFGFSEEETSDDAILKLFGNIHVGDTLGIERFTKDGKQHTDDDVWTLIKTRAGELLAENPMDPLVVESLKLAHKMGTRMAVWSSSPRELILQAIEANGLEGMFDAVVSVDDVDPDKHKPNPQGLLMGVKAMDVARGYLQPGENYSDEKPLDMNGVWMIGDSPNDVLGGKRAGASTVWLENPLQGHNAHEKRKKTLDNLSQAAGNLAVQAAMHEEIMPTVTIRTFDPEEAGYSRNVSMLDLPVDVVRNLTTANINFAKFLVDRELRAQLYRAEHVRLACEAQGIRMSKHTPEGVDGLAATLFGDSTTTARTIAPREVVTAKDAEQAQDMLERIIAKRLEGSLL